MSFADILGPLDGATVRGGCDYCDAEQTVAIRDGIGHITIHHDADCPWLARREGGAR